jgi:hypothetical protein
MKLMKIAVRRIIREEKGQALVLVLILLVVGGLIIAPLLEFMGTGLKVGKDVYENKMYQTYAADAGVEDGLWQIKHDGLAGFDGYDEYDYSSQWPYSLNESVNGYGVNVTIKNVWIPKDIPDPNNPDAVPDSVTAQQIIELGKLMITGGPSLAEESTYEIKISYAWNCSLDLLLDVNTIGIWLPPGFEYVVGSSDLEKATGEPYYSVPEVDPYKGGYAVVWNFSAVRLTNFLDDPEHPPSPMVITLTFQYTGPEGQSPDNAVSWINTSGVTSITYTWDADVKIYKILSVAGDCEVEAYAAKIEVRKLGAAISGDYHAIGNTLMTSSGSPYYPYYRNILYKESSATVEEGDIPSNAVIEAAWLYWSGWIDGAEQGPWPPDDCHDFNDWDMTPTTHWTIYSWAMDKEFQCYGGGSDEDRTLTMHISGDPDHCLDLSPYSEATVSWSQRESEWPWYEELEWYDCLKYAFSGDGGESWSENFTAFCDDNPSSSFSIPIPDEYLTDSFKMRFFLDFDEPNEYVYIDDITITVPSEGSSVEDTKVNRVRFGPTGNITVITTNQWQVEPTPDAGVAIGATGGENSWCYSCFYDATDIVKAALDLDTDSTFILGHVLEGSEYSLYGGGSTDYPLATPALSTAGQYMWTYAGWSLLIIYSSPETEGHQLYLFDDLRYVAVHTTLDFALSGFLVPDPVEDEEYSARITCFVGDGDENFPGDFIALLDAEPSVPSDQIPDKYKLWDGITVTSTRAPSGLWFSNPYDNVWNSQSPGLAANGVDIDTFQVTWISALLEPGDTAAWVVLGNASPYSGDAELIMLVYIIISFRSSTTSGGSISYLIRG